MKTTYYNWLIFGIIIVCFLACSSEKTETSTNKQVNHIVLCWLKDSGNIEQQNKIIEAFRGFAEIPYVLELKVGKAIASDRAIVDDSFDVCLSISFANMEDLAKYLQHPKHLHVVNTVLKPITEWILVYDFEG